MEVRWPDSEAAKMEYGVIKVGRQMKKGGFSERHSNIRLKGTRA